ncbi:MAG: hypothetical protein D4S02_04255 [Rhodocyclaceae bacterium]|nr:MAG: hypothetical protein D4S02_04255 [Rhodocyclaceae bacterium]
MIPSERDYGLGVSDHRRIALATNPDKKMNQQQLLPTPNASGDYALIGKENNPQIVNIVPSRDPG